MSEVEKQEGQKTVVAFITGLLIGGLLVWVFSSSPESTPTDETESITTTEENTNTQTATETTVAQVGTAKPTQVVNAVIGKGSLSVSNQKAGTAVALSKTTFPADSGWIVVRDYMDGVPGNVLGAARYGVAEGLTPTSVSLLRMTEKGGSYQVMFYTESGDKKFSLTDDMPVQGGEVTFKAE